MDPREQEARLQAHVGRVLGDKYRLRACVGIGGTGAVYRADQIALGRTVAVKLLAEELADDAKLIKRFHDEALAASRLNHPNTVSVIDYGQAPDGLLYLVMEFVRGPTLTQLIQQGHPLELDRVLDIVGQIVSGIEAGDLVVSAATFLIDAEGTIAREWRGVKVPGHAEEVLAAAKAL